LLQEQWLQAAQACLAAMAGVIRVMATFGVIKALNDQTGKGRNGGVGMR